MIRSIYAILSELQFSFGVYPHNPFVIFTT